MAKGDIDHANGVNVTPTGPGKDNGSTESRPVESTIVVAPDKGGESSGGKSGK